MYLSLYRKFRPRTFDKIVRQEHIVRVLRNQIESGSVGHAYLFCGPRGTGKTSVARIFARAVNCEAPKDGSPCGKCPTCLALQKGSLDVTEIDAASNNGVNEMRDLREKVQYPPVTGKYKVYIVDEVHMLTESAFNALLKTLEEPPQHAIFILATTEPHKIPATILSRCMRLDFKLLPEEDLEAHLEGILKEIKKPYEKEAVSAIARAGAGSDRDMLSIAEMCLAFGDELTYENVTQVLGAADFFEICDLTEALLLADMPNMLEKAETILSSGKAVGVLLRDLIEMLGRLSVAKTCASAEKLLSLPKKNFSRVLEIARKADGRAILRASEILAKTEIDLRFVSSPRICLETALMKISMPEADASNDALLVRLNLLEKKLSEGSFLPQNAAPAAAPAALQNAAPTAAPAALQNAAPTAAQTAMPKALKGVVEETPAERSPFDSPAPSAAPASKAVPAAAASSPMTAAYAYGMFIKLLRKSSKSGVLRVLCSDLSPKFEGEKLVFLTDSETVFNSLQRQEHKETVVSLLQQLGVKEYEVRLFEDRQDKHEDEEALDELKRDFSGYPIDVK